MKNSPIRRPSCCTKRLIICVRSILRPTTPQSNSLSVHRQFRCTPAPFATMKKLEQLFPITCAPEAMVIAIRKIRASHVLVLILTVLVVLPFPASAFTLEVHRENGETIFSRHVDEGERWCVHWNHSV